MIDSRCALRGTRRACLFCVDGPIHQKEISQRTSGFHQSYGIALNRLCVNLLSSVFISDVHIVAGEFSMKNNDEKCGTFAFPFTDLMVRFMPLHYHRSIRNVDSTSESSYVLADFSMQSHEDFQSRDVWSSCGQLAV